MILFGFRAKLVKIVEQNRTEFISQIKKITNSEPPTPQASALSFYILSGTGFQPVSPRRGRGRVEGSQAANSLGGVTCLILLSCKVAEDPWISRKGETRTAVSGAMLSRPLN